MRTVLVKICGLNDARGVAAALDAGADMVGFVFCERSPRHVAPEAAAALADPISSRVRRVALTVDAGDAELDTIVTLLRPDLVQMHGRETPARVAEVKRRYDVGVMRALPIGSTTDLATVQGYDGVADMLLLDAPPPVAAKRPGGHGMTFDWSLLRDLALASPWLVAGGLHAGNVAEALATTGAAGVDVSSGVESSPGIKDPARISAFIAAARS